MYYKPNIREKVNRIELASFEELEDQQLMQKFKEIMELIQIWTLPEQGQTLPIIIAHNKCSVRKGAADTLYYEIMTRAFSQGTTDFW